ncbi:MBL fold metallo-hydrolase [Candidatus Beckwithbacteria bacterium]|nr:MBL fold metallo-hydrolase [Candidatus Beckwithbacteria bacterium]
MDKITLTTIIENTCLRYSLVAQHGQSLLLNYFGKQYLFDLGEVYSGLAHNLEKMSINLEEIKGIIISHKHFDHCGSLSLLFPQLKKQTLYLPSDFFQVEEKMIDKMKEKYRFFKSLVNGKHLLTLSAKDLAKIKNYQHKVVLDKSVEIEKNLFIIGPFGDQLKEQALLLNLLKKGLVIITGCCHPGLEVFIEEVRKITKTQKIHGIIGGFHYKDFSLQELKKAADYLQSLDLDFLIPSHCTGNEAIQFLKKSLKNKVLVSGTGSLGVGNSIDLYPEFKTYFI